MWRKLAHLSMVSTSSTDALTPFHIYIPVAYFAKEVNPSVYMLVYFVISDKVITG